MTKELGEPLMDPNEYSYTQFLPIASAHASAIFLNDECSSPWDTHAKLSSFLSILK